MADFKEAKKHAEDDGLASRKKGREYVTFFIKALLIIFGISAFAYFGNEVFLTDDSPPAPAGGSVAARPATPAAAVSEVPGIFITVPASGSYTHSAKYPGGCTVTNTSRFPGVTWDSVPGTNQFVFNSTRSESTQVSVWDYRKLPGKGCEATHQYLKENNLYVTP